MTTAIEAVALIVMQGLQRSENGWDIDRADCLGRSENSSKDGRSCLQSRALVLKE